MKLSNLLIFIFAIIEAILTESTENSLDCEQPCSSTCQAIKGCRSFTFTASKCIDRDYKDCCGQCLLNIVSASGISSTPNTARGQIGEDCWCSGGCASGNCLNYKCALGNHGDVCTDDSQCSSGKCLKGCSNGGKFDYKKCLGPIIQTTTTIAPYFNSLILTPSEDESLYKMVDKNVKSLLYRGSRDGFGSRAFHSRCDGKSNTVTIILNDQNHVFGGYTSVAWHSSGSHSSDSSAYLFSLRRGNSTISEKYLITRSQYAIYGQGLLGPTFGNDDDIYICSDANINKCSWNNKRAYAIPSNNYLSGASNRNWLVTEIEVYQLE